MAAPVPPEPVGHRSQQRPGARLFLTYRDRAAVKQAGHQVGTQKYSCSVTLVEGGGGDGGVFLRMGSTSAKVYCTLNDRVGAPHNNWAELRGLSLGQIPVRL